MGEMQDLLRRLARSGFLIPKKVKEAMLDLPVEQFCQNSDAFYHDFPVQFIKCKNGAKKSISAPHMITTLLSELDLENGHEVCQLGSKGGYIAGLIAKIVEQNGEVHLFEQNEEVFQHSINSLSGWPTIKIRNFSDSNLKPEHFPRNPDRVLITGQIDEIPSWLIESLEVGAKIIAPVGNTRRQDLMKVEITSQGTVSTNLGPVCFGPLDVLDSSISPISPWEFSDILEVTVDIMEQLGQLDDHHICKLTDLVVDVRNLPLDMSPILSEQEHPFVNILVENAAYLLPIWPFFSRLLNPEIQNPGGKDFDLEGW